MSKIVMWLKVNQLLFNKKTDSFHDMIFAPGNHKIHKKNQINQDTKITNKIIPMGRVN